MSDFIDVRYAGFWRRVAAGLIDAVVLIPNAIFIFVLEGSSLSAAVLAAFLAPAVYHSYTLLMTRRYGGTLGKLAVGVRVQPVDGSALTWSHVLRRSSVDILMSLVFIAYTLVGLSRVSFATYAATGWMERSELIVAVIPWISWFQGVEALWVMSEFVVLMTNRQRRALHDFIAGTVVVVTTPPTPLHASTTIGLPTS